MPAACDPAGARSTGTGADVAVTEDAIGLSPWMMVPPIDCTCTGLSMALRSVAFSTLLPVSTDTSISTMSPSMSATRAMNGICATSVPTVTCTSPDSSALRVSNKAL